MSPPRASGSQQPSDLPAVGDGGRAHAGTVPAPIDSRASFDSRRQVRHPRLRMAGQVRRLLRAWRARRLSLAGLSHLEWAVAVGCLLVLGVECALLLAKTIGVTPPGG